jgi:hypothetical protein
MRILARSSGIRYSPVIAVALALAVLGVIGQHALRRQIDAAMGGSSAVDRLRHDVEPAVVLGGIVVSRNRHTIAGAALGCGSGAALGAAGAAVLGLASGGIGFAAVPPAAGLGCLVGGALGVAEGYPLDNWALDD